MVPASLLQILLNARGLISSPDGWIATGYGANAQGEWRPIGSADAIRFTLLGAIIRVAGGAKEALASARALFQGVSPELSERLMSNTDALTHEESLRLLDLAIAALDAEQRGYVPKHSGIIIRGESDPADTSLDGLREAVASPNGKR